MPPPGHDQDTRELCGILHADVVGYSRLMSEDEDEAVACIRGLERVFAAIVPRHDGKYQVQAGDSFLGTFPTAQGAVKAAIEIQQTLHEKPVMFLGRDVVRIRIGVHLGDVLTSAIGLSSNDINLAARIQDAALFGGVDISEDVYRQVRSRLRDVTFIDLGPMEFHNIGEPRRVYRIPFPWAVEGKRKAPAPQPEAPPSPVEPPTLLSRDEQRRPSRRVVVVSLGLGAFAVATLALRQVLSQKEWRGRLGLDDTPTPPTTPPGLEGWPLAIGVMEIKAAGSETPPWMCDITHQGLNALLTKFDKLKVFSKDVIDWKREKAQGASVFEIAKELGITRMINGVLIRSGVTVTLQARIVDAATGQQLSACEAVGTEDKLVEIQNDVGLELVKALKVPITKAEVDKVLRARTNVDLDVTKRFAEAFGGEEEEPPPPKPGAWRFTWPPAAHAAEADEAGVKALLERYREALEAKNLDQLASIYLSLSDTTREALNRYFQSANDLKIQFSGVTVLFEGDEALATFTRSDNFRDAQTGRDVNLEVRVSTVVAKAEGGWKIKALRKPS